MKKIPVRYPIRFETIPVLLAVGYIPFLSGKNILTAYFAHSQTFWWQWFSFMVGLLVFIYVVWRYWTENYLTALPTSFSKEENKKIAERVIDELKWTNHSGSEDGIWILKGPHWITVFLEEKCIRYNFTNVAGPLGRIQFLFGYDLFIASLFRKKIEQTIRKQKA